MCIIGTTPSSVLSVPSIVKARLFGKKPDNSSFFGFFGGERVGAERVEKGGFGDVRGAKRRRGGRSGSEDSRTRKQDKVRVLTQHPVERPSPC